VNRLHWLQAATLILALMAAASVTLIGLAINDIYDKLDHATIRLCVVEARVRNLDEAVGGQRAGVLVPQRPPPERECRAKPGK